jgi:MFS family permease
LIASRAVQGLGASLLAPAGLSLLVTSWPNEQQRSHALGIYGAVASASFAAGAVIGGLFVEVSWRLVFFVNVPVGVVLFVASWRLLPTDPPRRSGSLDVAGALAATAGVALLVLGVTRVGDTLQPTQPAVAVGAGLILLVAFVVRERRAATPLLNLDLLKDRSILGANECLLAYGACNAGAVLLVTLYLQEGRGLRPLQTGLCFIPQAVGAFALAGPASKLVPALGPRRALAAGLSLGLVALVGSALSVARGPLFGLLAALFVLGVSARIVQVASTLAGTAGPVAARGEGSASAVLTASRQVGSALGVAVVSATLVILHGDWSHRTAGALLVAAVFAFLGLLTTRVVPRGPAQPILLRLEHLFPRHAGGLP